MDFMPYIELLFQELPASEAAEYIKRKLVSSLEIQYQEKLAEGISPEEAFRQVLFDFGAQQGMEAALLDYQLKTKYARFQKYYPKMFRFGLLGVLILPLGFLVMMFSLEAKLVALFGWILSLIALTTFLLIVDYVNYRYRKLMENKADKRINKMSHVLMKMLTQSLKKNTERVK